MSKKICSVCKEEVTLINPEGKGLFCWGHPEADVVEVEHCPPTWEVALGIHAACIGNQDAEDITRATAYNEIVRGGKLIDKANRFYKEIADFYETLPAGPNKTDLELVLEAFSKRED